MAVSKAIIQEILKAAPDGIDLSGHIATEMSAIDNTRERIRNISKKRDEFQKRFDAESKDLDDSLATAQRLCKHWTSAFIGDPSGNNDSSHECDICGKTL